MHMVMCRICGERFDRDKIEFVKISSRKYAHKSCFVENELEQKQEQQERQSRLSALPQEEKIQDLEDYIKKLFNTSCINARIRKQIKEFREEYDYSYSGILKTLIYWYDIKKNSLEKANNGIGIVPYVFDDAKKFYYNLYYAEINNKKEKFKRHFANEKKVVEIPLPKQEKKQNKLFNLGDQDDE